MKNKLFLAAGILMLMPLTSHAQAFIKRAFNALITSEPAQVESSYYKVYIISPKQDMYCLYSSVWFF